MNTTEQYRQMLARQPVWPAPMCGISDYAFRDLCRDLGGPVTYTQMVSSEGLIREDKHTVDILDLHEPEPDLAMQVFGSDPGKLADSARRLQEMGAVVVDLNMGCPAKKITCSNSGSALLNHPDLVREIFHAMRSAVTIPLTVKTRWDWGAGEGAAMLVASIAEEEGLDGICLHARTREQGYKGEADWSQIARMKEHVSIPVLGNGDVRTADDALRMMQETGCDGIMVGRAAMGAPWLLGQMNRRVNDWRAGRVSDEPEFDYGWMPDWNDRREIIVRHARTMVECKGLRRGLTQFRKHAVCYMRGVRGVKKLRSALMQVASMEELEAVLADSSVGDV